MPINSHRVCLWDLLYYGNCVIIMCAKRFFSVQCNVDDSWLQQLSEPLKYGKLWFDWDELVKKTFSFWQVCTQTDYWSVCTLMLIVLWNNHYFSDTYSEDTLANVAMLLLFLLNCCRLWKRIWRFHIVTVILHLFRENESRIKLWILTKMKKMYDVL